MPRAVEIEAALAVATHPTTVAVVPMVEAVVAVAVKAEAAASAAAIPVG